METYMLDLGQMLFGEISLVVIVEIIIRTTIMFFYTLVMLRLIGARGVGQLSLAEFTLIIALGSAVGDPMMYLDVPLLYGLVILTLIVVFQRVFSSLAVNNPRISLLMDINAVRIVADGAVDLAGVKAARLSYLEVMAELRQNGAQDLAQVKRAYLETDGKVSVFLYEGQTRAQHPYSLLAQADQNPVNVQTQRIAYLCNVCGLPATFNTNLKKTICPSCGKQDWTMTHLHEL